MKANLHKIRSASVLLVVTIGMMSLPGMLAQQTAADRQKNPARDISLTKGYGTHFQTSDRCVACHNGLSTPAGEDISIGTAWRASMMANSGRDPYWMAGVRRETIDHPTATKKIQDDCTICHMPMMRYESKLAGGEGELFAHVPPDPEKRADVLAADGVSCSVCHQIQGDNLGKPDSFVGGFKIDETTPPGQRREFGPFEIDMGHTTIMRTSATFQPKEAKDVIRSSELCATCHTLYTEALNPQGQVIGRLPEQVPYQEWLHSDFKETRTCQSCHMPVVQQDVAITGVFGEPRSGFSRHTFVGGNFFIQRILNRNRGDLSVQALPRELDDAASTTIAFLQSEAAKITIGDLQVRGDRVEAEVSIENLGGHKLPTAYPSRRVWLHFTVSDRNNKVVFESGALNPDGSIVGNDNDDDPTRFEPHYSQIDRPDQVQIFESVMGDSAGKPTTGLLSALGYVKDNRLLPRGFDKNTADKDIAVIGEAKMDPQFIAGGDTIRYSAAVGNAQGPFKVEAELWYQPIAFRWAMNLKPYNATEPQRFTGYYEASASASAVILTRASATK